LQGEELTIDYGTEWWKAKDDLNCVCGHENCKYNGKEGEDVRYMNVDLEQEEDEANGGMVDAVINGNINKFYWSY